MDELILKNLCTLFEQHFGYTPLKINALRGDGSDRQIFRLFGNDLTCIGIHGNNPEENAAFLEFSRHFFRHALKVPKIYIEDTIKNIYLEEDLGNHTLFSWLSEQRQNQEFPTQAIEMYKQVLSALPHFQIRAGKHINYSYCYQYSTFQFEAMWFDMQYFLNRFAEPFAIHSFDRNAVEKDLKKLVFFCEELAVDYFLYRDFQSRNIMIKDDTPYFIDYQSGRRGALQYDLASMLFDAKADIPFAVKQELKEHYKNETAHMIDLDTEQFDRYFYEFALVRVLQALGAFGNLGLVKKKTHFLQNIPYGLKNIEILLEQSNLFQKLDNLRHLFEKDLLVNAKLRELR